jgi:transcriptional regulator with XRE-family HTH domain
MDIGERVRSLRKGKGMTQDDLADEVGLVDQIYISRLETGRLKNVRPDVLKALSETLGVSVEYLLLGESAETGVSSPSQQPVQGFLSTFFMLPPSKQSQVIDFTTFISREDKKRPEENKEDV